MTPSPNKYLIITDLEGYDIFTDKYGYVRMPIHESGIRDGILGINWIDVAKNFKGHVTSNIILYISLYFQYNNKMVILKNGHFREWSF